MHISIVGFGYIGAVIGAVLADEGHYINAVDNNEAAISELNTGECSVPEPKLREMIKSSVNAGHLTGSTNYDDVPNSDVILVTVGTPLSEEFDADLSAIRSVFDELSKNIKSGQIIMLKSTVPPGVTRTIANEYFGNREDIYIGFSPERLAEGNAIEELKSLPIVVGGINKESTEKCSAFWKDILGVEVIEVSSCEAAELVKLADNQWIDLNIALGNELAILCDALPYDLDILEIIKGANSLRKGQSFVNILTPSIGVGGYCLTKDPWFLSALAEKNNIDIDLPRTGRLVNDGMPEYCIEKIKEYFNNKKDLSKIRIGILGYSFKTNSGDVRFSPMETFAEGIVDRVASISVFDSTISSNSIRNSKISLSSSWRDCVEGVDCVVFGTAHDDLLEISLKDLANLIADDGLLFDGRRYFSPQEINEIKMMGISYQGVGRTFS